MTGERVGRESLLKAAANLFSQATFAEVASFIGPRPVASATGCQPGSVTYHFPAGGSRDRKLVYQALKLALDRVGTAPVDAAAALLEAAADRLEQGDPGAVDEIAAALSNDMRVFSPDGGPNDQTVEAEETALFLAAAVAPRDEIAADYARDFCRPMRRTYERTNDKLLAATGRRWRKGFDSASFAVATGALCDGWVWLRRFDQAIAPLDLFALTWMRLFLACSEPTTPGVHGPDGFVAAGSGDGLDPERHAVIARIAAEVYTRVGWSGLTIEAVAEAADVSPHIVTKHFRDRRGLAAAIWARDVPGLINEADRDRRLPLRTAIRANLVRFAALARRDPQVTAAFLDGVFSYTVAHGVPKAGDTGDPRVLVPLPDLLVPIIRENASQFRPGNAENRERAFDTAALLTNHVLHLAMTRPALPPEAVADRIYETTFGGMLRRRGGSAES